MNFRFDSILFAASELIGLVALVELAYLFFILHRRHGTSWSRVAWFAALGALLVALPIRAWRLLTIAMSAIGSGGFWGGELPWRIWGMLWWVAGVASFAGGIAFVGLAMQVRRERQVAQTARAE